jgi:preprotein translocase subunit SecF
MNKESLKQQIAKFHDKNYKKLLIIPTVLFLFSIIYMINFYSINHDIFKKDVSLTGGTSLTIYDNKLSIKEIEKNLSSKLDGLNVRKISDFSTSSQIAIVIETRSDKDTTKGILEKFLGYNLTEENSSFEFSGASLTEDFYKQLIFALIIAFLLMSIVVFLQFKEIIPSFAIIQSAFNDVFFSLVVINILGISISSAGIVAFLMLIGYSVDTDILLINRVLKREKGESINLMIFKSFSTGIAMTLTSLFAVLISLIIVGQFSFILYQIFLIMSLGLFFDLINTWITNVSIIKWYALSKKKNEN